MTPALPNDVSKKKPARQSAEQRAARSVLFCDVSARRPKAEMRLSGELAADTVADLGAQLAALIRTGHRQLLVDGRGLSQVSPVCVAVFNRAATGLLPLCGQLILTGLSNADADRLRRAGLHGAILVTQAPSGERSSGWLGCRRSRDRALWKGLPGGMQEANPAGCRGAGSS
jgi:anti-anti-sigma regulatory factor